MPAYSVTDGRLFVDFGDYADIHDNYTPDPECPCPETEIFSNFLMRLLAMMHNGGWRLAQGDALGNKTPLLSLGTLPYPQADWLREIYERIGSIGVELTDAMNSLGLSFDTTINTHVAEGLTSLIEQLTLLAVEFNAVKLQIDRLYIDEIKIDSDFQADLSGVVTALEQIRDKLVKSLTFGEGENSILGLALLREKVEGEVIREIDGMVSNVESVDENLVSLEMTEPTIELPPGTLVYAKTKVVRT